MEQLFMMDDGTPDETVVTPPSGTPTTPPVVPDPPAKQPTKNELLRELSKEHGVDLFSADGIKQFKEFQDSQKTEQQKLQERIKEYEGKETIWQSKQLEYESKLKASELGIPQDKIEDALKIAGGDVNKLAEVIKKYPIFKAKDGIVIGKTDPHNNEQPTGNTELEAYKAANPHIYSKKY